MLRHPLHYMPTSLEPIITSYFVLNTEKPCSNKLGQRNEYYGTPLSLTNFIFCVQQVSWHLIKLQAYIVTIRHESVLSPFALTMYEVPRLT